MQVQPFSLLNEQAAPAQGIGSSRRRDSASGWNELSGTCMSAAICRVTAAIARN